MDVLSDGTLRFTVRRPTGDDDVTIDLLNLKLSCERIEADHQLEYRDGRAQPTPAFLRSLAQELSQWVPDCTPSLAWQLWVLAISKMMELKKNMNGTPS